MDFVNYKHFNNLDRNVEFKMIKILAEISEMSKSLQDEALLLIRDTLAHASSASSFTRLYRRYRDIYVRFNSLEKQPIVEKRLRRLSKMPKDGFEKYDVDVVLDVVKNLTIMSLDEEFHKECDQLLKEMLDFPHSKDKLNREYKVYQKIADKYDRKVGNFFQQNL